LFEGKGPKNSKVGQLFEVQVGLERRSGASGLAVLIIYKTKTQK